MKKPRAKQRGTSNRFEVFRVSDACPSCLAGYFSWPQVALTHHACHRRLYAPTTTLSSFDIGTRVLEKCLVFSVTMTAAFRMTESSGVNKYNVFNHLQA